MDIEVSVFLIASTILSLCGLIIKRKKLNEGRIAIILFCSYGLASAISVLAVYLHNMILGYLGLVDNNSLCKVIFLALEFLIALGTFTFYKIVK